MSAPLLQQTSPADNLSNVAVTANLVLTFDQIVKLGTSGTIRIYKSDGTLVHTISVTDASQVSLEISSRPEKVTINPNIDLQSGTGYYVLIDAGVVENRTGEDFAGVSSPVAFNFTTAGLPPGGDTTAPTLSTTTPADNATGVAVGSNLVLTFSESVQAGSGNIEIRKVSDNSVVKAIAVTDGTQVGFSGSQLTINPTTDLAAGTEYYVSMASGVVRDLANNNFAGISSSTTFNFTTASPPADTTAPTLQSTTPADNATSVLASANIVLNFDEAVKAGSGNVEIRKVSDDSVVKSINITDATQVTISGSQVTINPTTSLDWGTAYYVKLGSGVVLDLANNAFAGISSTTAFNFTTRDITAPLLVDSTPDPNQIEVGVGANIVLTFNEAVKAGSGTIYLNDFSGTNTRSFSVTDTSQVSFSGNVLTINPTIDLSLNTDYYVTMASDVVQDLANNNFSGLGFWWELPFGTTDTIAPLLVDTSPADGATGVDRGANLTLKFDETVTAGSGNIEIRRTSDNGIAASIAVTDTSQIQFAGSWLTIDPTNDLTPGNGYYVLLNSGVVRDLAGNGFAGISSPTTFNFSVPTDSVAPLLVSTTPTDGSTDVAVGANIVLTFDEVVTAGSGNIEIRNAADGTIARSIAVTDASQVSFSGYQLTINPTSNLADGVGYYVTMGSGVVKDVSNNPFAGISSPSAFNFSTAPHLVTGTPSSDALLGDAVRNDLIDGRTGLDTLTGQGGDDTYLIRNYEGGQTSILFYTADGSYIYSYLPTDDELNIGAGDYDHNGGADIVQIDYNGQTSWWLWFSTARLGTDLLPGAYPNAQSQPFPDPGFPALAISGGFFGFYYYDTGSFTVHEAVFDYSDPDEPILVSLSINFERYSPNGGPTLYGRVNYNYAAAGAATIDTIVEAPGGGTDTIVASVSVTLPNNVENLTLLDTAHMNEDDNENLNGTGNSLPNVMIGNAGNNIIDGAGGADTMSGGGGDDSYVVDNIGDSILENLDEGTDSVQSSVTYTLDPNVENLTLTGSGNINGGGNDLANILIGNAGTNVLSGGDGDDSYTLNSVADSIVEGASKGNDTVFVSFTDTLDANVENLTLTGTGNINGTGNTLNNILIGSQLLPNGSGQNVLTGGIGNDLLNGRTGVDTLIGGVGDDTYIIENYEGGQTSVLIQGQQGERISQGRTLSFLGNLTQWQDQYWDQTGDGIVDGIFLRYMDGEHWWTFTFQSTWLGTNLSPGTYVDATLVDGTPGHARVDVSGDSMGGGGIGSFTIHELIIDYSGDTPVLVSLSISFEQTGYPGAPPLYGLINYNYAPAGPAIYDTIVENPGEGIDTVESAVSYTLGDNLENLGLTGLADNINGTGNGLNNTITGNYGDNVIDGGAGADAMTGGYGNDTYIVDNVGDTVFEEFSSYGNDTVVSPFTYTLGNFVENLTLTGTANLNGTGNEHNNILTGNSGTNVLIGGLGNDTYVVTPGDTIVESAGEGDDTVEADFSYTLSSYLEHLTLTGSGNIDGTGNASNNSLRGNDGNNVFNPGAGNDWMHGYGGNDTFRIVAGGAGNDTIEGFLAGAGVGDVVVLDGFGFSNFSAVVAAMTPYFGGAMLDLGNGQTLWFYGVLPSAFAANDFSFVNATVPSGPDPFTLPVSGAYTNTLTGTRRVDNLTGTAANNRLDGRQGNDTMTGLAGDDTYLVDASGDNVVESSSNGIDTVISSASTYTLANNVENLTLTGTNTHTATGNGLDNLIIASARPDTINGGIGNDILRAGTGACVLTGGAGNDIFDFDVMGSQKQITDFTVGQDLVDLRTLLAWYGGSDPLADNAIALSAVSGGVLVSVKASAGGSLLGLVKITGVSLGDLDVGSDILWDA